MKQKYEAIDTKGCIIGDIYFDEITDKIYIAKSNITFLNENSYALKTDTKIEDGDTVVCISASGSLSIGDIFKVYMVKKYYNSEVIHPVENHVLINGQRTNTGMNWLSKRFLKIFPIDDIISYSDFKS